MTTNELLNAMTGVDQRRRTKSAITLANLLFKFDSEIADELGSVTLNKPSIEIERRGQYIQVEICFISSLDNDLKLLWNAVELYGRQVNDMDASIKNKEVVPMCSLTIVPLALEGQYHATATNPIFWALTSKKIGQNANVIRLLYPIDNFNFFHNDDINIKEIEQIAREEIIYENRQNAFAQRETSEVDGFGQ